MADVAVRTAVQDDAAEIARIQLETWRIAYASQLPEGALDGVETDAAAARWSEAVAQPPTPAHRVLVAYERAGDGPATTVGFAATTPADPSDVEVPNGPDLHDPASTVAIPALVVEPRWGRRGHGSRLLAAVVDLARADGAEYAVTWVLSGDTASQSFYASAGWQPDGTVRELSANGDLVREVRLHASLAS
jgi:GNAT superfamily N-acetyltransferase